MKLGMTLRLSILRRLVKEKSDSGKKLRYSRFCDVTSRDFGAKKDKCLKIHQKYVCEVNCKKSAQKIVLEQF